MTFEERCAAFARFNPEHVRRRLARLASNLATAGGLCAAFELGNHDGQNAVTESEGCWPAFADWHPGCGYPAPRRGG